MADWLWLLLTVAGPALLGLGIAYGIVVGRRRRANAATERRAEEGTEALYAKEEEVRKREEAL
jgi:hypothetical protein